jgi:hypothetical protein
MPTAGPVLGEALTGMLTGRGITLHPECSVERIDPAAGEVMLTGGETACYNLLLSRRLGYPLQAATPRRPPTKRPAERSPNKSRNLLGHQPFHGAAGHQHAVPAQVVPHVALPKHTLRQLGAIARKVGGVGVSDRPRRRSSTRISCAGDLHLMLSENATDTVGCASSQARPEHRTVSVDEPHQNQSRESSSPAKKAAMSSPSPARRPRHPHPATLAQPGRCLTVART